MVVGNEPLDRLSDALADWGGGEGREMREAFAQGMGLEE